MSITSQLLTLEEARDAEIQQIKDECENGIITPEQRDACITVYTEVYQEKINKILDNNQER